MAGGTGGHIFPALALAHYLQAKGWDVQWMGTKAGLEADIVPKHQIPLHFISVQGLRGTGVIRLLKAPFYLLLALMQALKVLLSIKPTLVVGMGGFVSGPGGVAAWLLRRPLVICEQNAIAGFTNECLSRLATKVLEGFPHSFKGTKKAVYTGNPVREVFLKAKVPSVRFSNRTGPIRLLIVGGSRGALALNTLTPEAIQLLPEDKRPEVWHQAGGNRDEQTRKAYEKAGVVARVEPFIDDMVAAYEWADLVLCRSGALTVAELSAVGVGSILVPYPYAVDNHQWHNGRFLEQAGAAVLISQKDLTPKRLSQELSQKFEGRGHLQIMAEAAYEVAKRDALTEIGLRCEECGEYAFKKV